MSDIYHEGFDALSGSAEVSSYLSGRGWVNSLSSNTILGRKGSGRCIERFPNAWYVLNNLKTVTYGFAMRTDSNGTVQAVTGGLAQTVSGNQWSLAHSATTGAFTFYRGGLPSDGGVLLATSSATVPADTWCYIELRVTTHDTSGAVELRINGVSQFALTGVNTRQANQGSNALGAGHLFFFSVRVDDLYIYLGDGDPNDQFLGDVQSLALNPIADGAVTDFTPSAGTANYAMVDESPMDSDLTHNEAVALGNVDLFDHTDCPAGSVHSVTQVAWARKTDSGSGNLRTKAAVGTGTYSGTIKPLTTNYGVVATRYRASPATAQPWSVVELNSSTFGYENV